MLIGNKTKYITLTKLIIFAFCNEYLCKTNSDETNMFANDTQTPLKTANMESHPTLN